MFFKNSLRIFLALISLGIVLLAVFNPDSALVKSLPFVANQSLNSIIGLPGKDGPVLVVKIDDTPAAHPQIGIENADLVYIEQVEGGLTRLAAVFSSHIPERIGPVRSARISDIDLLAQYGKVGFAYSGVQRKMRPVIDAANLFDLGAQNHSSTIYTNDLTRTPPYAMVLRADRLMDFVQSKSLAIATSKNMGWDFGSTPAGGKSITDVHLSWPASSYDAHWSQSDSAWLLDHSHEPDVTDSGKRISVDTLVIQEVSITDSIYHDKVGGVTPFSATVGSGTGYILRDGKVFPGQWNRPTAESGTSWTDSAGNPIAFKAGHIWVALTDKEPIFSSNSAGAGTSTSK